MVSVSAEPRECSVARTLEIVGEKWALLAVREVFLGNGRFDQMVRRTGAPRDTMAARLRVLVGSGILVILTLMRWGDQYLAGPAGPPLELEHQCGHLLTARLVCEACGEPVVVGETRPVRSLGATRLPASAVADLTVTLDSGTDSERAAV
jgi:hypothetical protein